jgi:hypothetical protein
VDGMTTCAMSGAQHKNMRNAPTSFQDTPCIASQRTNFQPNHSIIAWGQK